MPGGHQCHSLVRPSRPLFRLIPPESAQTMALREEVGAMSKARGIVTIGVVGLAVLGGQVVDSPAGAAATLRIAHLSPSIVDQHRGGWPSVTGQPMQPDFRSAGDHRVVDRAVLRWPHSVIQRIARMQKPIRIVEGDEAAALGGRGTFPLAAVRVPGGLAAWTEIDVVPVSGAAEDVRVLEVGGEIDTVRQVLASRVVRQAGQTPEEWPLATPAFHPGAGVAVIQAQFGLPLGGPDAPGQCGGSDALEALVGRSLVQTVSETAETTNGGADLSPVESQAVASG